MATVTPDFPARAVRTDMAPLKRPDHADYFALLGLTTSGGSLPPEVAEVLTTGPVGPLATHGTALGERVWGRGSSRRDGSRSVHADREQIVR